MEPPEACSFYNAPGSRLATWQSRERWRRATGKMAPKLPWCVYFSSQRSKCRRKFSKKETRKCTANVCLAYCSQSLSPRRVQRRSRCTSGRHHRRSFTKSQERLQVRVSRGSKDIGHRRVTVTSGSGDTGSVLRLKGHIGRIRTTTTIAKGGNGTKDIGTARATTTAIGAIMIKGGGTAITTNTSMSTTTKRQQSSPRGWGTTEIVLWMRSFGGQVGEKIDVSRQPESEQNLIGRGDHLLSRCVRGRSRHKAREYGGREGFRNGCGFSGGGRDLSATAS